MILENYSYSNIFNNPFSPKLKVIEINWINPIIYEESVEKLQIQDEKSENNEYSIVAASESVSYELKDITPKKGLFRRK